MLTSYSSGRFGLRFVLAWLRHCTPKLRGNLGDCKEISSGVIDPKFSPVFPKIAGCLKALIIFKKNEKPKLSLLNFVWLKTDMRKECLRKTHTRNKTLPVAVRARFQRVPWQGVKPQ